MVRGCDNCDQIAHLIKKRRFLTKQLTLRKPLGIKITIDYWQKKWENARYQTRETGGFVAPLGMKIKFDYRQKELGGGICGTFRDENYI